MACTEKRIALALEFSTPLGSLGKVAASCSPSMAMRCNRASMQHRCNRFASMSLSLCATAHPLHTRFTEVPRYSAPRFLNRPCDRTLGKQRPTRADDCLPFYHIESVRRPMPRFRALIGSNALTRDRARLSTAPRAPSRYRCCLRSCRSRYIPRSYVIWISGQLSHNIYRALLAAGEGAALFCA